MKLLGLLGTAAVLCGIAAGGKVEIQVRTESSRSEGKWKLRVEGRTRGLPDGAIVTLRLHAMAPEVRWSDRVIRWGRRNPPVIRKAKVEGGSFRHIEALLSPGRLELEACFDPADQESPKLKREMRRSYRPYTATFRVRGSDTRELVRSVHRDARRLAELGEEAREILRLVSDLTRDPQRFLKGGAEKLRDLEKLRGKVSEFSEKTALSGSAGLLSALLGDAASALMENPAPEEAGHPRDRKSGGCGHKVGTGVFPAPAAGAFSLAAAHRRVKEVRSVVRREAGLLILLEARDLLEESAEGRVPEHAEASLEALEKLDERLRLEGAYGEETEEEAREVPEALGECRELLEAFRGSALDVAELRGRLSDLSERLSGLESRLKSGR